MCKAAKVSQIHFSDNYLTQISEAPQTGVTIVIPNLVYDFVNNKLEFGFDISNFFIKP
jgi:hypothetical protein